MQNDVTPLNPPVLLEKMTSISWGNLQGASLPLALCEVISQNIRPILIITPDTLSATRLAEEIPLFAENPNAISIYHFPDWETLPYDQFSPHQDIISARLSTLNAITQLKKGAIIAPISTLMQKIAPIDFLTGHYISFKLGDHFELNNTLLRLEKAGYRRVEQVQEHGEFAVRGAIIDLFPMGSELPLRIDLFDSEIDSIRTFSPDTQRTLEKIDKIEILPAKEFPLDEDAIELFRATWRSEFSGNPLNCPMYQEVSDGICPPGIEYYLPFFFKQTASFFDYLPKMSCVFSIGNIHKEAEHFWQEIVNRYEQRSHDISRPILKPGQIFLSVPEVFNQIKNYSHVKIQTSSEILSDLYFNTLKTSSLNVDHKNKNPLSALEAFLIDYKGRVLFCAETLGRKEILLSLFYPIGLQPKSYSSWQDFLSGQDQYGITIASLDEGLQLNDPAITLIAEAQLFGKRVPQSRRRKESEQELDAIIKDLTELHIGAPIVHIDHGVGRYLGLQTLKVGEQITEFLALSYADDAKLYVPVSSLHLISRYSGGDLEHAPLHKLGTEQWQKAKRKAAEQIRDIAAELLDIYAKREAMKGFAFKQEDGQYAAFAASFPFEETIDQKRAIDQVIEDMKSDKPMDRLICGDVGFGKTEVAMRAAFFAALNGKQVAVLVPTTLLAEQHYQTFRDRFANWPMQVGSLSRFRNSKEQKKIIEQLSEGTIDIVIGTHKLLQESIRFKSLGLIIIDEEHRFGVQQKERLKTIGLNVDILALTATPIPRTLNMAFSGIRDLSLIATPPKRRLSIKTFIHEYQNSIIQEAILREILRGGQVYFLHNDVATIEKMARDLEKLIPEVRVGIAHGQMRERELESVMSDFYHRRFNTLVCSTIIESGIDIPSANTIIIHHADHFGLAQLHQLRGRVGRSHHQAYAYLLIPNWKSLTKDAEKRLNAFAAYDDLGIGFTLATHDLEIRGAGELLGRNQSGQMHEIGFTLYMDLLSRAVNALKSGKEIDFEKINTPGIEIDLQIPAIIPEKYLGDVHLRLQFYKRIANAKNNNELDNIQVEMIDRFGLLPDSLKNLFALSALKQKAEKLGILKIEANQKGGKIEFNEKPDVDPMRIIKLIQTQSHYYRLEGPTRLKFKFDEHKIENRITLIENILEYLAKS